MSGAARRGGVAATRLLFCDRGGGLALAEAAAERAATSHSHHHHAAAAAAATAAAAAGDGHAASAAQTHHGGGGDHAHAPGEPGAAQGDEKPHAHKPAPPASTDGPRRAGPGGGGGAGAGGGGGAGRSGAALLGYAAAAAAGALLAWAANALLSPPDGEANADGGGGGGGAAAVLEEWAEAAEDLGSGLITDLAHTFMSASVFGRSAMLMAATLPMLVASGWLYRSSTPGTPWVDALLKAFSLLFRVPLAPEKRLAAYAVVNATFLCGFFSFALLLSIVSEEVQGRLEVVRSGKLPVREEGHVVILNWKRVGDAGSVHERASALFVVTVAQYAPAALPGEEDRVLLPMSDVPLLLEGLAAFSPPGSRATVLSSESEALAHSHAGCGAGGGGPGGGGGEGPCWHGLWVPEGGAAGGGRARRWMSGGGGGGRAWGAAGPAPRTVRFVRAPPMDRRALLEAGLATCDTLIFSPDAPPSQAQLLAAAAASAAAGGRPHGRGSTHAHAHAHAHAAGDPWQAATTAHPQQEQHQSRRRPPPPALPQEPEQEPAAALPVPPLARDAHVLAALLQLQDALLASGRDGAAPPQLVSSVSDGETARLAAAFFSGLSGGGGGGSTGGSGGSGGGGAAGSSAAGGARGGALIDARRLEFVAPDEVVASLLAQLAVEPLYSRLVRALLGYGSAGAEAGGGGGGAGGGGGGAGGGAGLRVWPLQALGLEPRASVTPAELSELARLRGATALGLLRSGGGGGSGSGGSNGGGGGGPVCVLAPALGAGPDGRIVLAEGDAVAVIA
ncbi:hypothetical protein Rsub_03061 [Raphidocelis subcapitata]|uniref:Uncharacterized protein n=1 Tax=Raphidocelis subcapitata TaxID=307507 RepID=A0A2V0NYU0_9CHLO|nr:hypothetical protein Rsub_03061 [Raphidocelis subcapitata]|eukprot:GBF90760.1 hypothetical protein Rsub_03061 [Raphidocelis subcapitata]